MMQIIAEYDHSDAQLVQVPQDARVGDLRAAVAAGRRAPQAARYVLTWNGEALEDDAALLMDVGIAGCGDDRVGVALPYKYVAEELLKTVHGKRVSMDALLAAQGAEDWEVVTLILATERLRKHAREMCDVCAAAIRAGRREVFEMLLRTQAITSTSILNTAGGPTPLIYAASLGQVEMVECMLAHGASVVRRSRSGSLPTIAAAEAGSADVLRLLLDAGAPPDARDYTTTAAHSAATRGHLDALELLVSRGASLLSADMLGQCVLTAAAGAGQAALVEYILTQGDDVRVGAVNAKYAEVQGEVANVQYSPLCAGVASNDTDIVRMLLGAGADPNQNVPCCLENVKDMEPLAIALQRTPVNGEMVLLLVRHGAARMLGARRDVLGHAALCGTPQWAEIEAALAPAGGLCETKTEAGAHADHAADTIEGV